jgi:hypothetical protein
MPRSNEAVCHKDSLTPARYAWFSMYWLGPAALIFDIFATVISTVCAYDAVLTADSTLWIAGECGDYTLGSLDCNFRQALSSDPDMHPTLNGWLSHGAWLANRLWQAFNHREPLGMRRSSFDAVIPQTSARARRPAADHWCGVLLAACIACHSLRISRDSELELRSPRIPRHTSRKSRSTCAHPWRTQCQEIRVYVGGTQTLLQKFHFEWDLVER